MLKRKKMVERLEHIVSGLSGDCTLNSDRIKSLTDAWEMHFQRR